MSASRSPEAYLSFWGWRAAYQEIDFAFLDDCGDSEDADAEVGDDVQGVDAIE